MNKAVVYIPLAFVLGGLVGAWRPSEELRALKAKPVEQPPKQQQASFGSFAKMVNIPDAAKAKRPRRPMHRPDAKADDAPSGDAPAEKGDAKQPEQSRHRPSRPEMSPEDLRARIDEAAELWRTRVDIARAQTIEKLGLDDTGVERFNAALENMNLKLRDSIQTIADRLANEESMTPELGVRLMGDLCSTLAESYDEIGTCVGDDRRGEISALELHNFIDPSVAEPLISVQGKLEGFGMGGPGARQ